MCVRSRARVRALACVYECVCARLFSTHLRLFVAVKQSNENSLLVRLSLYDSRILTAVISITNVIITYGVGVDLCFDSKAVSRVTS